MVNRFNNVFQEVSLQFVFNASTSWERWLYIYEKYALEFFSYEFRIKNVLGKEIRTSENSKLCRNPIDK